MKLHVMPGSCALASHIALKWAGATSELVLHDRKDMTSAEYRSINPKGQVPALELGNGKTITESLAVLVHIADAFPDANLFPAGGYARDRGIELLSELTSDVHPAWAPFFAPERFIDDKTLNDRVRETTLNRIEHKFQRLNALLEDRSFLLERRSVLDAYLYALSRWKASLTPTGLQGFPNVARHLANMEEDGSARSAVNEEGIELITSKAGVN